MLKTGVLCGGTSGAKVVGGLYRNKIEVNAIVNTADDEYFLGLYVSPDFDSVIYSLAGIFDFKKNWGIVGDTFNAYEMLKTMKAEPYIMLGDRDLAVHIYRTYLLKSGLKLTDVFEKILKAFGLDVKVAPPSDSRLKTMIGLSSGEISFEEYYVKRIEDSIKYLRIDGSGHARASEKALEIIDESEILIVAPSNPLASIFPIISVKDLREKIKNFNGKRVAISPFKGGVTYKGPASKMMRDLGIEPEAGGIIKIYDGLIDYLIVDTNDYKENEKIIEGVKIIPSDITINEDKDVIRLYNTILNL
ncbi:MAG: 2-phospho-L-lactate transferase CofD family protein [Nitrososphaeria archaeon]